MTDKKSSSTNKTKNAKPAAKKSSGTIDSFKTSPKKSAAASTKSAAASAKTHSSKTKATSSKAKNPSARSAKTKSIDAVRATVKHKPASASSSQNDLEKAAKTQTTKSDGKATPRNHKFKLPMPPKTAKTTPATSAKKSTPEPVSAKQVFKRPTKAAKTRKIFQILGIIFSILLVFTSLVLCSLIVMSNFLPTMYLIPAVAIIVVIAIIFATVMCHRKAKTALKTPFFLLSLLLSGVYLVGIIYLNQTFSFFDNLKGQDYITEKYYVLVNQDSEYQDLKSLSGKTIGTFDEGIEIYQQALQKLQSSAKVQLQNLDSINALPTALAEHKVDAILLSAVHKDVITEEDSSFEQNTRIIYTIEIKVKAEQETIHPDIDVTAEPFTIFISGSDAYGNISDRSRSDVNMLATVNPNTHEVLLTSIPRDYYVQLHGTTGSKDKLTHAGIYGVQMSANTIADLLDIKIDYYVKVNFSTLVSLVDTIGGIDVYSDQEFRPWTNQNIVIPKGNVHMDGATALAFARERKSYSTGDRHRVQNQQDVLTAILKKVSSSTVILTKYSEILNDLAGCMETNFGKDEISNLIKLQLQNMPSWKIAQYSLNGSDAHDYTYSMGQQMLYVMMPNADTVQAAHNYITGIMAGKTIEELHIPEK